ncbi:P-loop containing nucleoside triphosphate hydrolase protein [Mycena leptocephala]|nr:P-loop containing nucleoside triphosphate hydrolase protein [Mycena leptocephala]
MPLAAIAPAPALPAARSMASHALSPSNDPSVRDGGVIYIKWDTRKVCMDDRGSIQLARSFSLPRGRAALPVFGPDAPDKLATKHVHCSCKDCIVTYCASTEERGEEPRCPTCLRGLFKENDLIEVFRPPKSSQDPQPDVILKKNDFHSSTKLDALVQNLRKLREQDPCFRAVVLSSFFATHIQLKSVLDLIQVVLKRERFEQYQFDGSMDVKKRALALDEFRAPIRKPKVLVVSLKAGGVGLNLTAANRVFMIGQEKTVYVKYVIVSNTIEGRIVKIQKRKTAIVKEVFRGGGGSGGTDPESIENLNITFGEEADDAWLEVIHS